MNRINDDILYRVEKPARYIGGEFNSYNKNIKDIDIRFAFCFPDVYEIGMSHLGMKILYYTLNQRLLTLESRMNRIRKTVNSARVARIAIRVKNPIEANKYTLRDIEKIINYYELSGEITSKEAILCLNDLEFYNRNLTSETMQNKKEEEFAKEQYNNVPNILNAGYEVIEEPEVIIQRKEFLDKMVNEAINTLRYANKKEDIVRILENYERYDLENNEYNYIIIKVLNNISNELISYYNLLLEKDTYSFRRNRREIIEDYYMELNKYLIIRDYYDKCNWNEF